MDLSTLWELVSRLWPAVASGLVIKLGQWGWRWLQEKWRSRRTAPASKRDEPQRRRQPRQSAYRVSELSRLDRSQGLERHIAARGLVPLETRSRQRGIRAARSAVADFLFTTRMISKPGFRISGWQCHLIPGAAAITGSFVLAIRLHPNENRRHLEASLRSQKGSSDRPRLVVIASISDLFDEASPVRCYAVDTFTTSLDDEDLEMIGVQSCDGVRHAVPTCSTKRVGEVTDDALWLITDNAAHTAPSEDWGSCAGEIYETQDDPRVQQEDPATLDELNDDYRYIRKRVRGMLIGRGIIWLVSGPGFVLLVIAIHALLGSQDEVAISILAVWSAIWLVVFGVYLGFPAAVLIQTWWWRRRDSQGRGADRLWRGGTTDCLVFGSMVRRGRVLSKEDWKRFWLRISPEK